MYPTWHWWYTDRVSTLALTAVQGRGWQTGPTLQPSSPLHVGVKSHHLFHEFISGEGDGHHGCDLNVVDAEASVQSLAYSMFLDHYLQRCIPAPFTKHTALGPGQQPCITPFFMYLLKSLFIILSLI